MTQNLRQTPLTCSGHTRPVVFLSFSEFNPEDEANYYSISACKGKLTFIYVCRTIFSRPLFFIVPTDAWKSCNCVSPWNVHLEYIKKVQFSHNYLYFFILSNMVDEKEKNQSSLPILNTYYKTFLKVKLMQNVNWKIMVFSLQDVHIFNRSYNYVL